MQDSIRDQFMRWQCLIRQTAIRKDEGRPCEGMRPALINAAGEEAARFTTLINKAEIKEAAQQFKHMAMKTQDPAKRYEEAIKYLSSAYYQKPKEFGEELSATFNDDSVVAAAQIKKKDCDLVFKQHNQTFHVPCKVRKLKQSTPLYDATYWHNLLFNHALPGDAIVLAYAPKWNLIKHTMD